MICIKCKKEIPEGSLFCMFCGANQSQPAKKKKTKRSNGEGTVFRRPGRKGWYARITIGYEETDDHKRIQKYRTVGSFRTETEAKAYCVTMKQQQEGPRKVPDLYHYWQQYSEHELADLSHDKILAYRKAWERLSELHHKKIDKILTADMQRIVSDKAKTYYPARDMKTLLTQLFKFAAAEGFVSKDPPTLIKLPKLEEKAREPFSDLEQAALWKAWEGGCKSAAIPLVMIYTGMMPGELMGLKVSMIDFSSSTIIGAGKKTEVRKKAAVYLPDTIIPVLQVCIDGLQPTANVFPRSEQHFYNVYYEALDAAGTRRLTPYSCRHTTATALAITEGIAPQTIKQVMRWTTTRMLDRYAHPTDSDALAAVNAIKR